VPFKMNRKAFREQWDELDPVAMANADLVWTQHVIRGLYEAHACYGRVADHKFTKAYDKRAKAVAALQQAMLERPIAPWLLERPRLRLVKK
jgi:hypothetical protein